MSNVKNYIEQGGDKWVVNDTLEITAAGNLLINGLPLTRTINQANSTATTIAELKIDLNELLTKLKAAGLMEQDNG